MRNPEDFGRQVEAHVRAAGILLEKVYGLAGPDPEVAARAYRDYADRLQPYLADTGLLVASALESGRDVLAEGAQGTLLDLDHGTYPYVTSSNPTAAGAFLGLGVGPRHLRRIIGVTKAFQTRVGTGPFPTEVSGALAERLRGTGENPWDEFGTTTGRPRRCGWLDGVLLRYATRVNSFTELTITKLDILSGLDPIRLAVAYKAGGHRYLEPPEGITDLSSYEPEFKELQGWQEGLPSIAAWESLPKAAQDYVRSVEDIAGVPVRALSVGPQRDQIILRQ
jgi:adenylosuccinate synthase